MTQNPYQASKVSSSSRARRPFLSAHSLVALLGSVVLVLLGLVVAALSRIPSDAPGFFLLTGLHLFACGMLGVAFLLGKLWWPVHHLFCWTSMLLNAALAVRIGMLFFDGSIRGPLMIVAPLLVGLPAAINVVAAVVSLRRGDLTKT